MKDLTGFYKDIAASHGSGVADAVRELHSLFDDGIYKWLAGLWDGNIGGFYYSNSARDNAGFLPDMESTAQAFNNLESTGIMNAVPVPESMQKKAIAFMQSKQDPEDGYFYHPQWGKDINTSRRARDLGHGISVMRRFGAAPLYPTALDRIGAATSGDGASDTVPEHLRSATAFINYLEGLGINEQSYSIGHRIGQQAREIAAAGLTDVCIDFLNSTQKKNGFWEDTLSHSSSNGTMKISCTYVELGRPFPNIMTALDSAIEVLLSDQPIKAITEIFNPPFTLLNFLEIMKRSGDNENLERARAMIRERAVDILRVTTERLRPFKKPDGAFSYLPESSSFWSQGKPVCIEGSFESDVNANSLANGSRVRPLLILGITPPAIFDGADARTFYEMCGEM